MRGWRRQRAAAAQQPAPVVGAPATKIDADGMAVISGLQVIAAKIDGQRVFFTSDGRRDPIQRCHRKGTFFESAELDTLAQHLPKNAVFVDIGANVGNHSLFVGTFLKPAKLIPVEPNPQVYNLLLANIYLNQLEAITDLSFLGFGVSDVDAEDFGLTARATNLGAVQMVEAGGTIPVRRGDTLLGEQQVDCVKIDVEGMEMQVLRGLVATIARCRPIIMIEVPNEHEDEFQAWLVAQSYRVAQSKVHYETLTNYLLVPQS